MQFFSQMLSAVDQLWRVLCLDKPRLVSGPLRGSDSMRSIIPKRQIPRPGGLSKGWPWFYSFKPCLSAEAWQCPSMSKDVGLRGGDPVDPNKPIEY